MGTRGYFPGRKWPDSPSNTKIKNVWRYTIIPLTPWIRVLLEKLIVTQLIKKFFVFWETRRSIITFTRAHHWSLSWGRCIQSTNSPAISLGSILILAFHLCLYLPHCLFTSGFWIKYLYAFPISPMHATCPVHLSPWLYHSSSIYWSMQVMKLLRQSISACCHFIPVKSKYFPQHPILIHPQSVLPSVWGTEFYTHTKRV